MSKKRRRPELPLDLDYVNQLLETIAELKEEVRAGKEKIEALQAEVGEKEGGRRGIRIWTLVTQCESCRKAHVVYVAFLRGKGMPCRVYYGTAYGTLAEILRAKGFFIKERLFTEKRPPEPGRFVDGEWEPIAPGSLLSLPIPDCIPDDLIRELEEDER